MAELNQVHISLMFQSGRAASHVVAAPAFSPQWPFCSAQMGQESKDSTCCREEGGGLCGPDLELAHITSAHILLARSSASWPHPHAREASKCSLFCAKKGKGNNKYIAEYYSF